MKRVRYPVAALIMLLAAVARAAAPVRIDVASMEFARSRALGLESVASRPGTHLKLLLTHGDPDWRAIDFETSAVTSFRDDEGTSLAVPDSSGVGETGTGIQPAGSRVTADGMSALLAIWGGGLPSGKADEIRVTGSAAIFCGPEREMTVDRADVRLAGGETFNVQPFRVVTSRGDQTVEVELRFLRSDALVTNVLMMVGASRLPEARASKLTARGNEWIWQGEFVLPPGIPKGVLAIRYQPIERVETVPFDISVPLAFRTPPTNFVARWLRRFF